MNSGRAAFTLLVVAALLLAPSLIVGNLISHSSPQNLIWAEQFAGQFRSGVLYPRWLPESFDGLGGPAFYFYPPAAFWVDALVDILTLNAIPVAHRLPLSSLLLLWWSGLAMRAWLEAEGVSNRVALYGALAYMAAPYHLINYYYRGAYAEFAASMVLPLVMLSIRRISDGKRYGVIFLAVTYAALPMTHVPTALLASVTIIPMYVLYRGWRLGGPHATRFLLRCAFGGLLGLGLAAIYLVPAMTLQGWIQSEMLWMGDYRIDRWFLLTPGRWPGPGDMMRLIVFSAAAYTVVAVAVLLRSITADGGRRSGALFWAVACFACIVLASGAFPWFWELPFVAKVQFPWRIMLSVEFAAITAFCLTSWRPRPRAVSLALVVAAIAMAPVLGGVLAGIVHRTNVSLVEQDRPADVKEYLPAAYSQKPSAEYANFSLEPLANVPWVACTPAPRSCRAVGEPLGAVRVEVEADAPTNVVLRRFAYPIWRLEPPLPIVASDSLQLVSFTVSAGYSIYRLERMTVRAEKAGIALSALSLFLLIAACVAVARRRPSAAAAT